MWSSASVSLQSPSQSRWPSSMMDMACTRRCSGSRWLGAEHIERTAARGSVVLIEKLDGLSWKTAVGLERNLDRAVGITYRNFLPRLRLSVQGRRVVPIDPLFTTPGARFYDIDSDRAEPVRWPAIQVNVGG